MKNRDGPQDPPLVKNPKKEIRSVLIRVDIEGIKCFGTGDHGKCHRFPIHGPPDVDGECKLIVPVYGMRDVPECAARIGQKVASADAFDIDIGTSPVLVSCIADRPGEVDRSVWFPVFCNDHIAVVAVRINRLCGMEILLRPRDRVEVQT